MNVQLDYLADHPRFLRTIANWYFDEWGHLVPDRTLQTTESYLTGMLNRDKMPCNLVAVRSQELLGCAELKFREMGAMFPDKEHWLGGVYVAPAHRGQGFASAIVEQMAGLAARFGVKTLWLQTEKLDGGLYAKLGWQAWKEVDNHGLRVLIMERRLT